MSTTRVHTIEQYLRAGAVLVQREAWPEAYDVLSAALNEHPEHPGILYLLGYTLRAQGHLGLALITLGKSLAKQRDQPNIWMAYGATLHDLHLHDEALEAFGVVAKMLPLDAMPPANMAAALTNQGRWRECIEVSDRALQLDPSNHIAKISRTFAELALGRWRDAWRNADHLYGNHLTVRVYRPEADEEPAWDGTKGQTVVVTCDQGIGDQIMFAQCLPELVRDCKQVIVECSGRMAGIFSRSFPDILVYPTLKDKSLDWPQRHAIDAHIHISHLGKFYRNSNEDFPRTPYVVPRADLVAKWQARLAQYPRPWIGISWKGGIQTTQKHLRSIDLADLRPVLELPGTFVDLSYQDNSVEVARWNIDSRGGQIVCPHVDKGDYDDTLALAWVLDDIVSVTTSLVHACGAMGKPIRVLVPAVAQWRYAYHFKGGEHMIWYDDSVRLYRQRHGEEWAHAINRVAKDMQRDRQGRDQAKAA